MSSSPQPGKEKSSVSAATPSGVEPDAHPKDSFRKVFVSYKHEEQSSALADYLERELNEQDFSVFVDRSNITGGEKFHDRIQREIEGSKYFIALLSQAALDSKHVGVEVDLALGAYEKSSDPRIFPICFIEPSTFESNLDYKWRIRVGGRQFIQWQGKRHNAQLLSEILRAVENPGADTSARRPPSQFGGRLIAEHERESCLSSFVRPKGFQEAHAALSEGRLVCVIGESSIGKQHTALALGLSLDHGQAYCLSESSFSSVERTGVEGSVLIFVDFSSGSGKLDEAAGSAELNDEFEHLRGLLDRGNRIVLTALPEDYKEIERNLEAIGWPAIGLEVWQLSRDSFADDSNKYVPLIRAAAEHPYNKPHTKKSLLALAEAVGDEVPSNQCAARLRDHLQSDWGPPQLSGFLRSARNSPNPPQDWLAYLGRDANLDELVNGWLKPFDESALCFVLAVVLYEGLSYDEVLDGYERILVRMSSKYPDLTLKPLEASRRVCGEYVLAEESMQFTDERVAQAVRRVLARDYYEYLRLLAPEMERLTIPRTVADSENVGHAPRRTAFEGRAHESSNVARLAGQMLRRGTRVALELIGQWANDPIYPVRRLAELAVREILSHSDGRHRALQVLEGWAIYSQDGIWQACTAANCLGDLISAAENSGERSRAFRLLEVLADDNRGLVLKSVSIVVENLARAGMLPRMGSLVTRLAASGKERAQTSMARALYLAEQADLSSQLLLEWVRSVRPTLHWSASYHLLVAYKAAVERPEQRYELLGELLQKDPEPVLIAILRTMQHQQDHRQSGPMLDRLLFKERSQEARTRCLDAMVRFYDTRPGLILDVLEAIDAAEFEVFDGLALRLRQGLINYLVTDPANLLSFLRKGVEGSPSEDRRPAWDALVFAVDTDRDQGFANAMAAAYAHNWRETEAFFSAFPADLGDAARSFVDSVRWVGITSLLGAPETFVHAVYWINSQPPSREHGKALLTGLCQGQLKLRLGEATKHLLLTRHRRAEWLLRVTRAHFSWWTVVKIRLAVFFRWL